MSGFLVKLLGRNGADWRDWQSPRYKIMNLSNISRISQFLQLPMIDKRVAELVKTLTFTCKPTLQKVGGANE